MVLFRDELRDGNMKNDQVKKQNDENPQQQIVFKNFFLQINFKLIFL